ncbi:MAG: glycosyl transferase family 2 [Candidatus Cryptobacteroides sp.]
MEYTAIIRTLGKAGEKYQTLLDSLVSQTIPPKEIIVYIAEGYPIPAETVGRERYVYVKKGMVAQRALRYDEVETEYMLFLDDDLYLPEDFVQTMYHELRDNDGDVISPDIYPNHERGLLQEILVLLSGRMLARRVPDSWGYKVLRTGGYSYRKIIDKKVYPSQTNAGACFFCKKNDFLNVTFEEESWLDESRYPVGEDQVMYYKMYMSGLKVLTSYNSGIKHLDAGANLSKEKEKMLIYSDFRFKTIFWHRFIFRPEKNLLLKAWDCICIGYAFTFAFMVSLLKLRFDILAIKYNSIWDAVHFLRSDEYKRLPAIK